MLGGHRPAGLRPGLPPPSQSSGCGAPRCAPAWTLALPKRTPKSWWCPRCSSWGYAGLELDQKLIEMDTNQLHTICRIFQVELCRFFCVSRLDGRRRLRGWLLLPSLGTLESSWSGRRKKHGGRCENLIVISLVQPNMCSKYVEMSSVRILQNRQFCPFSLLYNIYIYSNYTNPGWWFQPIWKKCSSLKNKKIYETTNQIIIGYIPNRSPWYLHFCPSSSPMFHGKFHDIPRLLVKYLSFIKLHHPFFLVRTPFCMRNMFINQQS